MICYLKVPTQVFMSILCFAAFGQSTNGKAFPHSIKINVNYHTYFDNGFTIGNIAPALMKSTKRNNFHELELSGFKMQKSKIPDYDNTGNLIGTTESRTNSFGLRYQYTLSFIKKARLNPQIGLSLLGRYESTRNIPGNPNSYERK